MTGRAVLLGVVATIALGAACSDDDAGEAAPASTTQAGIDAGEPTWDGRMEVDFETGDVRAPGFNELIDDAQPSWANTARGAAEMLVRGGEGQTEIRAEPDSTVVATISGLPDDSTEAVRYELHFRRGEDGLFRFENGSWSQRCQPGRGHDDQFLREACV